MQISSVSIYETLDYISKSSMRNMDSMMRRSTDATLLPDASIRLIDDYYHDGVTKLLGIELLLIDNPKVVSYIHDLKLELDAYRRVLKAKLFTLLECSVIDGEDA